jgi:methionyl-tRNA synthetase
MGFKKFYITTAIDYVNAPPHLGHLYEKVCADVLARFHRLLGEDVFFLTGTDENAPKNEKAAREAGVPVKQFVDENAKKFIELCKIFSISYDDFIRTTEERHVKVAQQIFKEIFEKGDIYKGIYEGLYCQACEEFKTEKDLVDGKCPQHGTKPEFLREENYFFKLSKYKEKILKLFKRKFVLPEKRKNEIIEKLKGELRDISVSRKNLTWGITTPIDQEHKIYVWIDALVNYISALGYPDSEKYKKYWPADLHVIGKDINWFHSVIWPALLFSLNVKPPKLIFAHGFLTIEGKKLSKSAGIVVDPFELAKKYPVDGIRYYLIREIPFGEDGDFKISELIAKNNNELVANIGNFIHRVLTFIWKNFGGEVPKPKEPDENDLHLKEEMKKIAKSVKEEMKNFRPDLALEKINEFATFCNAYFQKKEPWRTNDANCLYFGINAVRALAILLEPFTPSSAEKIWNLLNLEGSVHEQKLASASKIKIKPGHKIKQPEIIFQKIEEEELH